MSIYIPGMDLPKSCSECFADDNGWCNILGCSISDSVALRMIERRRDCPLVEVPAHGRLIDADALQNRLENSSFYEAALAADAVRSAQTIITADPEEPVVAKALRHGFYGTMYGEKYTKGAKLIFIKPGEAWESNGILYFRWGYPGPDVNAYKPEDYGKTWAMMEYELTDSIPADPAEEDAR